MNERKLFFWFEELGQEHNEVVGKKGANLGEMFKLKMPVAPGFAVSLDACRRFMAETGANEEVSEYMARFGKVSDISRCNEASQRIRSIIEEKEMPEYISKEICSRYDELCEKTAITDIPVSARSSGATSRPGMFDTYLNLRGKKEVLQGVKRVWSSAFSPRAIWYRLTHGIPTDADVLGVVVQKFLDARAAGVTFCADPVTGDTSVIVVEATWGLGEGVVGGTVPADRFVLNKETLEVQNQSVADKTAYFTATEEGIGSREAPPEKRIIPCLRENELKEIGTLAKFLEQELSCPQDIEWAIDPDQDSGEGICLFQTRPVKFEGQKDRSQAERLADILAARFK